MNIPHGILYLLFSIVSFPVDRIKQIRHFVEDEDLIDQSIAEGNVVMHLSEVYEKKYNPHYRIIHHR